MPSARDRMYVGMVDDPARFDAVLEQLRADPDVAVAEPDFIGHGSGKRNPGGFEISGTDLGHGAPGVTSDAFPDDRLFGLQWGLQNTGQAIAEVNGVAGEDINVMPAWNITTGSSDITVAVLDSGQPDTVPDFGDRIVPGYNFVSDNTSTADDHGHGTNVASIALATGNNGGTMAGIDWNAKIMPVKILDENNAGLYSWWVDGIYWAVDNGADVLNMSVGGSSPSTFLQQAVADAIESGVHVIACMMNTNNNVTFIPASYDGVVSVGAINNQGARAVPFCWGGGSNYGNHIDLVAPGERIVGLSYTNPEAGTYWCGTSQATPMVAGVVSLMLSIDPGLTPAEVKQILTETSRGDGSWNQFTGWGVLDAHAAVSKVLEMQETGIAQELPHMILLDQNYPNPFNPGTLISYQIPEQSHVTLSVYSVDGRLVAVLVDGVQAAGHHAVPFDATGLGSGVYLYEIISGGQRSVRQMTLVK
jgi:thermitase